jgi:hypothetical protein
VTKKVVGVFVRFRAPLHLSYFQKNKEAVVAVILKTRQSRISLLDVIILSVLEVAEEAVLAVDLPVEDLAAGGGFGGGISGWIQRRLVKKQITIQS